MLYNMYAFEKQMKKQNKINKIIQVLIISDIFFNAGWGLINPIFAIYLLNNIEGGNAQTVGFATAVFWIVKSILQVPLAKYLDNNHGEKDDYLFMVCGLFIAGLVPFGFLTATRPEHIYILQVIFAIGMAMTAPAWYAIFTRHIDKGREAYEWSIYSTMFGFSVGLSGAIGGTIADKIGFEIVYIFVGVFNIFSSLLLLLIEKDITTPHKHKRKGKGIGSLNIPI